jgi:hypothetical protein
VSPQHDHLQATNTGNGKTSDTVLPSSDHEVASPESQKQRETALNMLAAIERRLGDELSELQRDMRQVQASSANSASLDDLDARFKWLVEVVSDRFVTLGNQLVKIEREMIARQAAEPKAISPTNGASSNAVKPEHSQPIDRPSQPPVEILGLVNEGVEIRDK